MRSKLQLRPTPGIGVGQCFRWRNIWASKREDVGPLNPIFDRRFYLVGPAGKSVTILFFWLFVRLSEFFPEITFVVESIRVEHQPRPAKSIGNRFGIWTPDCSYDAIYISL